MQTAQFTELKSSASTKSNESLEGVVQAKEIKNFLKRVVRGFWSYTEETGKSDTSSFDGIL